MVGTLTLADVSNSLGIHLTTYATGCIFHYDNDKFKEGNGVGFLESDTPNFLGSYYSKTKVCAAAAQGIQGSKALKLHSHEGAGGAPADVS